MSDFDIQSGVLVSYRGKDKHVVLPGGITTIATFAFVCSEVESVEVSEGVTGIKIGAFRNCYELETINLPDSLLYIENDAFAFCKSLQYYEYDGALYLGNDNNPYLALIRANRERTEKDVFHADTKVIGYSALYDCNNLVDVVIPEKVRGISGNGFLACKAMRSITIPNSVIYIGEGAFRFCKSLSKVVVPEQFAENNSAWWKERFEAKVLPIIALDNFDKNAPLTKYILRDKVALVEALISLERTELVHKALEYSAKIKSEVLDKLIETATDNNCAEVVDALIKYKNKYYSSTKSKK